MFRGDRPSRRHRSWPQRLLLAFNAVVVLICFTSAAGLAYVFRQASDIQRFGGLSATLDAKPAAGQPENFLLVGVDNSQGLPSNDPVLIGRTQASLLSDTIMIVRVDPQTHQASILSLPRDLYVPIADTGAKAKINSALPGGGPARLIKTIQQDFGIPINRFIQVNFAGFRSLVEAVNGVPIYFPWPARDTHTGFSVTAPGCVTLDGVQALAYARSRYFETRQANQWVGDPTSDFGRISRQQQFMKLALKRAIAKGARNPFVLTNLVGVAQANLKLDDKITTRDLINLGTEFRNFDPDTLQVYTPPATTGDVGAESVVLLDTVGAQPIFDLFRGKADPNNPLRAILVEVLNGSGTAGQAQKVLTALGAAGFGTTTSSDASTFRNQQSEIRYAPGAEKSAVELARHLDATPRFTQDATLAASNVVLVTGRDFTALVDPPRPAAEFSGFLATTTTATSGARGATTTSTTTNGMVPATPPGVTCG